MKNHFLLQFRIVSGNDLSFPASKEEAPVTPSRPVRPSEMMFRVVVFGIDLKNQSSGSHSSTLRKNRSMVSENIYFVMHSD